MEMVNTFVCAHICPQTLTRITTRTGIGQKTPPWRIDWIRPIQTVRLCNSCSNSPSASDAETSSMRGLKSGGTFARKTGKLVARGHTIIKQVNADLHTLASSLGGL